MSNFVRDMKEKVLDGYKITLTDALMLEECHVNDLLEAANELREKFSGDDFDLCTIMNAKSGKCSENCKFCAQSAHYSTGVKTYNLISEDEALKRAKYNESKGAKRFSLVTSGKGLADSDLNELKEIYKVLKRETGLSLCASHGLLTEEQAKILKESGVTMYHHNVEAGPNFFKEICTTHNYQDRIDTIKSAIKAGMTVCSGGIIGIGEAKKDRFEMAIDVRDAGVKSVPINILNPVEGTPLGKVKPLEIEDILKTVAIYRFILPDGYIRFAGGRNILKDEQLKALKGGINAALIGDFLTTVGNKIDEDIEMIREQGFNV